MNTNKFLTTAALAAFLIAGTGALAQSANPAPAPASNETVNYVSQLPTPSELSRTPAPAGARISKISQSSGEIAVTYVLENGQTSVVTYRLLSATNAGTPAAAPTSQAPVSAPPAAQPSSPAPTYYYDAPPAAVYQTTAPVYYDAPYYYYPYPWYPPVGVSLGFGFRGGFRR